MPDSDTIRIGIDWGGTKIEVIAINPSGGTLLRERVPTPRNDYTACIRQIGELVQMVENRTGKRGTVGIGIPGTISPATSLVKNANSTWMNSRPLRADLETALERPVKIANDANCFAVSESVDGAAAGKRVVVGIIIGTGCGSGISIEGKPLDGATGIAGEFGHIPCPAVGTLVPDGRKCWCGKIDCFETYLSGPAFIADYDSRVGGRSGLTPGEISTLDNEASNHVYRKYCDRLGMGISILINIVDPDAVVLGGGMSNITRLYDDLPEVVASHAFTDVFDTPILQARHGDSSGVRGAAWLWD